MRIREGFYRSYKTHSYCSRCGNDGWYSKVLGLKRCPIHGQLLRIGPRLTRIKSEKRWEKAY